jgi:phage tail sheath protein FI
MPEYLSPGVYVEEVDAGPVPIEGVSTSTCGAVGFTLCGPSDGKPVLVTSYSEFVRTFGGPIPAPPVAIRNQWGDVTNVEGGTFWQFPLSVKGFFDNGGQRMYVKRVFASGAAAASNTFGNGLVAEITKDSPDGAILDLSHLFGISNGTPLTVWVNGAASGAAPTVTWYDPDTRRVKLSAPVGAPIKAGRDFVVIAARAVINAATQQIPASSQRLTFGARQVGAWANGLSVRFRPMTGPSLRLAANTLLTNSLTHAPESQDPTTVASTSYPPPSIVIKVTAGTGAQFAALDVVTVGAVGGVGGVDYTISAVGTGAHADELTIQPVSPTHVDPQIAAGASVTRKPPGAPLGTQTTAASSFTDGTWTITVPTAPPGFNPATKYAVGDHLSIGGGEYVIQSVGTPNTGDIAFDRSQTPLEPWGVAFPPGTLVKRLRRVNDTTGTTLQLQIPGADQLYVGALLEFDNGRQKNSAVVGAINGNTVSFSPALTTTQYYEGDTLRVMEGEMSATFGGQSELIQDLRFTNSGQDLVNAINRRSQLVTVAAGASFPVSPIVTDFPTIPEGVAFNNNWLVLTGGDDDLASLKVTDFVGVDGGSGKRTGIQALEDIDEVAICIVPGMWSQTVQAALVTHCELLRYRFAILDPPDGQSIQGIQTFREPFGTRFAALYYPWVRVHDPLLDTSVDLAPSGHIAGIYARVDDNRGVFKAPANEVIQGIDLVGGLAQDVNKREQDTLNPVGINALRFFPDRGQLVWGARTLIAGAWKYINVKRTFIYVEHSIDRGTQWVVFEPNDESLWARVRQSVSNFLESFWRSGGLQGTTTKEAFFVKCDRTTMTQDDLDNGRLICLVGIAPVYPAEFVIFRIQQKTLDSQGP